MDIKLSKIAAVALAAAMACVLAPSPWTRTSCSSTSRVRTMFVSQLERGKPTAELGKALRVAAMLGLDVRFEARG